MITPAMARGAGQGPRGVKPAGLAALLVLAMTTGASAQTVGWQTGTAADGQVVVKYRVTERVNEDGVEVPRIEYVSTTTAKVPMERLVALLKDPAKHKEFMGDQHSKALAHPSDNLWVVYSHYAAPWPFPDNDRVTRMTLAEDPVRKTATFSLEAAPTLLEPRGVKRVTFYSAVYTLEEKDDGTVALTLAMKMSPPNKAPLWMIRSAFPSVGAEILANLVKLAGRNTAGATARTP